MDSEFLDDIAAVPHLKLQYRVGNQVLCCKESAGRETYLLATDENDWYGVLTIQYQRALTTEQGGDVSLFLRSLRGLPFPQLLSFGCHEATQEVRATLRWPLHEAYFGVDDAKYIVSTMFDTWITIEPFIDRVVDGEDVDAVVAEANAAMTQPGYQKGGMTA